MRNRCSRARASVAAAIALVLALPAGARADHWDGNHADDSLVVSLEGRFSPSTLSARHQQTNAPATLRIDASMPDHASQVRDVTYAFPSWQFPFEHLRPAQNPGGGAASSCADVMDNFPRPANADDPATMARAEVIGTLELQAEIARTRRPEDTDAVRNARRTQTGESDLGPNRSTDDQRASYIVFGHTGDKVGQSVPARAVPGRIGFLDWNAGTQTARLCIYLYAQDGRVDRITATSPTGANTYDRTVREHLVPATMTRTTEGWELRYSARSILGTPYFNQPPGPNPPPGQPPTGGIDLSIMRHRLALGDFTVGNWHLVDGAPRAVPFARTPVSPGAYDLVGTFTTCAITPGSSGGACNAGTTASVQRTVTFSITDTDPVLHRFATFASPRDFAIITGGAIPLRWTPPALPAGEHVKGYVITVARPSRQDTRHFQTVITDPAARADLGLPAAGNPCGPAGAGPECALEIPLPTYTTSGGRLEAQGKYVASIVSIFTDGHRSDGRCDNGTPDGLTHCPPHLVGGSFVSPGLDAREFFIQPDAWPLVYQDPATRNVLMVDFGLRRARVLLWRPGTPYEEFLDGAASTIAGDDATGGVVVFAGAKTLGRNHVYVGYVTTTNASGRMLIYDTKGLPGTPSGMPSASMLSFEGARV